MKALSLWQPWASLMACSAKHYETRRWPTNFRGELAICAAKKVVTELGELQPTLEFLVRSKICPSITLMPTGCVLAVVHVVACVETDLIQTDADHCAMIGGFRLDDCERVCGNYSEGRFAWITRRTRPLKIPVPVVGRQGLFNLPPEVEAKVRGQLS